MSVSISWYVTENNLSMLTNLSIWSLFSLIIFTASFYEILMNFFVGSNFGFEVSISCPPSSLEFLVLFTGKNYEFFRFFITCS
jgi:FtsH-binding integral membrane protein